MSRVNGTEYVTEKQPEFEARNDNYQKVVKTTTDFKNRMKKQEQLTKEAKKMEEEDMVDVTVQAMVKDMNTKVEANVEEASGKREVDADFDYEANPICPDGTVYAIRSDVEKKVSFANWVDITSDNVCKKFNEDVKKIAGDVKISIKACIDRSSSKVNYIIRGTINGCEIKSQAVKKQLIVKGCAFNGFEEYQGMTENIVKGLNCIASQLAPYFEKLVLEKTGEEDTINEIYEQIIIKAKNNVDTPGVVVDDMYIHISNRATLEMLLSDLFNSVYTNIKEVLVAFDVLGVLIKNKNGYQYKLGDGTKEYRIRTTRPDSNIKEAA